ncbi:MAG: alpha/beta fold hydrolase [Ignavibacteriales bacterium]|nr:MAG: alpha/beta fold hydrolase [Ignavibacteriales bacterium]
MWSKQVEFLQNSHYCISYDIRGLGKSPGGDRQFTMETLVDDLLWIVNEFKLDKPVLCGLSMGGYISLRAVERAQEKLGGLILCDTKSFPDDDTAKLKRANGIKQINIEGLQKFCEATIPNTFADSTLKERKWLYEEILNRAITYDPAGVKGCMLAMLSRTDTTSFLEKIMIPTLIICGEHDKLTPPLVMKDIHNKIKDSELVIIPEAGHMAPVENPEAVNKAISDFLKKRLA